MNLSPTWLLLSFSMLSMFVSSLRIQHTINRTTKNIRLFSLKETREAALKDIVFFFNDNQKVKLPDGHKFPMDKYRRTRDILEAEYAEHTNLIFRESPMATVDELLTTHCPDYVNRFLTGNMTEREIRVSGFPWTERGVKRALTSVGGTLAATRFVMDNGGVGSGAVCPLGGRYPPCHVRSGGRFLYL